MILQNITIVNLGAIEYFSHDFADDVNLLKVKHTNEISYAVRVILNHKDIPPLPRTAVREDTKIEAILSIAKKKYNIIVQPDKAKKVFSLHAYDEHQRDITTEYLYLTDHCAEQDSADVFVGTEREMPLRFLQYANEELYFPRNELHRLTGKMSSLKTFRAYLKQFIKQFEPQVIREGKLYEFILKSDGRYGVRYKNDDGMPVCLSESEQIIFRYLCFIKTLEFWSGFEELRNLHGLQKPILVENFLERIDESIDIQILIKRTAEFNRQMIILTI
jgi:hypothetical protein